MTTFALDPKLEADTFTIAESECNLLLLMNDVRYPWCILVPKRANTQEIYQLPRAEQIQLLTESSLLAETLMDEFILDKMNIGALGNVVSQLHIHHVGRTTTDDAWPNPVWGHSAAKAYSVKQKTETTRQIAHPHLTELFNFR
ncbi:hypothetical protein A9Q99_02765 [Gammaproteobacteria bacterium 45_16_T64]|nr:hypothetical protein A9Q99_02765 [Gammaproteobacteria bacterium 45_16_T64]